MQGRGNGNIIQQSFGGGTYDSQGTIQIQFDAGWRNDPNTGQTYDWVFEIYNVTQDASIGGTAIVNYTLADDDLGATPDWRNTELGEMLTFTYDNTNAAFAGDEIAFRITTNSSANSFDPTGWIDNVAVVPEPPSAALLGLGGLALILRRRK